MFTGIVETIGLVKTVNSVDSTSSGGNGFSLTITNCREILTDCHLGDSIAVNGVCLTVTEFNPLEFKVGVSPETLRKTNLGEFTAGQKVNLERAIGGNSRYGGHFVQGHVDTTVEIKALTNDENSLVCRFYVPANDEIDFLNYIVPKGYVCLDGASLTVTKVSYEERCFEVMLIAYTQDKIVTSKKKVGDKVNLEVDQLGKYVESMVRGMLESGKGPLYSMIEATVERQINKNR